MHPSPQQPPLARACLEHLLFEQSELQTLRDNLESLHRAILAGDFKQVAAITTQRSGFSDYRDRTSSARDAFCRTAASALGLPTSRINLDRIMAAVPEPWSTQVRDASRRVVTMVADIRAQSQRTSTILTCCRSMARQILVDVGGIGNKVERYGPSGVHVDDGRPDSRLVTGTM
jgi:hypothetical protein